MKKEIKILFGKKNYLLGERKEDGKKVWLEEASFDCGWYWGLGYIEIYNKRYSDIDEHTHFDSLFLNKNIYDSFVEYFSDCTLEKSEIWKLLENMQTLYTLRKYSDMLHCRGSHITDNSNKDFIQNDAEYKRINDVVIPKILQDTYKLFGEV